MGVSSAAPSECLLPLITGSKKQFIPSENTLRSFPTFSLCVCLTHTHTHRWKTHINSPHIMQRHQLLVTPPQQAGKRARREMVVGGHAWLDWFRGVDEKVWRRESRITSAAIRFVYRPFWGRVVKLTHIATGFYNSMCVHLHMLSNWFKGNSLRIHQLENKQYKKRN